MDKNNGIKEVDFIKDFISQRGYTKVIFFEKRFYVFNTNQWISLTQAGMTKLVYHDLVKQGMTSAVTNLAKNIVEAMSVSYYRDKLPTSKGSKHLHLLANKQEVFNVESCEIVQNTADLYLFKSLNVNYDEDAECPLFLNFLQQSFAGTDDAQQRIDCLQEHFASCLIRDMRFQVFLILFGSGGEGKSLLLQIMTEILGSDNVSAVPLERFSDKFRQAEFEGKLANFADENSISSKIDSSSLKALSSGSRMSVERKNAHPFTMISHAKIVLALNGMPRILDSSNGMARRMHCIIFPNKIAPKDRDPDMLNKLIKEKSGIFNWLWQGLERVLTLTTITPPPSSVSFVESFLENDPIEGFIKNHLSVLSGKVSGKDCSLKLDVYKQYCLYCKRNGINYVLNNNLFSTSLRAKGINTVKSNGKTYFSVRIINPIYAKEYELRELEDGEKPSRARISVDEDLESVFSE